MCCMLFGIAVFMCIESLICDLRDTIKHFTAALNREKKRVTGEEPQEQIAALQALLRASIATEEKLHAENLELSELAKKHRKEAEEIRQKFKDSEEQLKSELMDIVNDLMAREQKKRQEYQEEQDEQAFDKLDEVNAEFEGCCEKLELVPEAAVEQF